MRKFLLAISAVVSLVFSVLQPIGPATSATTVNKTFTVTKSDGTPYAGVSVALMGWDDPQQQNFLSAISTTNSSGVATVTVSSTAEFYGYAAQPPANDFSHANFIEYSVAFGQTESYSIRMRPANLVVELKSTSGQSALPGSWVHFPGTGDVGEAISARPVLRSGPFGIDVSAGLSSSETYVVKAEPNAMAGQFWGQYALRVSDSNAISIYPNATSNTALTPRVVNSTSIYDLSFSPANLHGKLTTAQGGALNIPAGVTARVTFNRADSDGNMNPDEWASADSNISASGLYDARINNPVAGKYFPVFSIAGSLSIPSFTGAAFYIDSNGYYSNSNAGPFVAPESFELIRAVPAASAVNVKIRVVEPNSTTADPAYIIFMRDTDTGSQMYVGAGRADNGLASLSLSDGVYRFYLDLVNPDRTRKEFTLVVDQGEASLTLRGGGAVNAGSDGVFQLSGGTPNLKIRVVNPDDNSVTLPQVSVDLFNPAIDGDNFVSGTWAQSGLAYLSVADGTYDLRLHPNSGGFAERAFTLVVSGSNITLTDPSTQQTFTAVDGFFNLAPYTPNVKGRVVNSAGQPVTPSGSAWVNVELQKWVDNNHWEYVQGGNAQVMADGTFGIRAQETGTFRLSVRTSGRVDVANAATEQFVISDLAAVRQQGDISLPQPMLKVRVTQSGRNAYLNNAGIQVSDHQGYDDFVETGQIGVAPMSFPAAGTYYLTVTPPWGLSSGVAANKYYVAVVTGTPGALSATITGVTATDGYNNLSLGIPNVTGKIVAPDGSSIVRANGVWVNIQAQRYLANENRWEWTDYWTQMAADGSFGFGLEQNGTYRLRIEPNGVPGSAITRTVEFTVNDSNRGGTVRAFGDIRLSPPSAKFKIRIPGSTADIKYAGIEVRKDDQWYDWINTDRNGVANFSALEAGNYEFIANPNGDSSVSGIRKSYSATVTETAPSSGIFTVSVAGVTPDTNGFTILNLGVPNITGKLVDQSGAIVTQQNKIWVNIQVQKYDAGSGNWDWQNNVTNVRNDGTFGLSVGEAGTYRLLINPYGRTDIARTVTSQFVITSANASTFTKAFGNIRLNGPTISGTVSSPDDTSRMANAQVVAIDDLTGQEMWEYSSQTDAEGRWSMMLPKGSYSVYARSPWGNQTFGNGDPVTGLTVAENGTATLTSGSPSAIALRLGNPTWSGTVVAPGTSNPLAFTSVCLSQESAGKWWSQCTESDTQGRWALTKPSGFTGFNDSTRLSIRENRSAQYAEAQFVGRTDVETKLGTYVVGQTFSNKTLSPAAPNTSLTITAGNAPAANLWVSIERENVGWLTSGMTNSQGVVRLNIPTISSGFKIRADVQSNRVLAETYVTTVKTVSSSDVTSHTSNNVFSDTVVLGLPNFAAEVVSPGSSPAPVKDAWVDVYNMTTNQGVGGSNSQANGNVALRLDSPSSGNTYRYQVRVNSPWANPDLWASRTYFVDVDSAGAMVVHADTETGTVLPTPTGSDRYRLALKAPSVTGTVELPDATLIRDSYVEVRKNLQGWQQWVEGAQSRANGAFGLALDDGSYELTANVPWNQSGLAKSARCEVTVAGGIMTNGNSACVADGKVKLGLRQPNLKVKMVHSGAAVANANVNISIGNWNTWAQAGRDGVVSLFIDDEEVRAKNSYAQTGGQLQVRITVDPPYGNSEIVRWDCSAGDSKPLCDQLTAYVVGTPYINTSLRTLNDVEFAVPNTRLNVKLGDGTTNAGQGAWAVILLEENGWKRWLTGSNTNADGQAVFNIDDTYKNDPNARFTVEVNAPYQQRANYSQKNHTGLTWAQVNNHDFALGTPNLKLTVKQALSNDASAFGWVGLEEVDTNLNWVSWLGGYGLDQLGTVSLTLPSSKKIRLTLNPGPGAIGARTFCVFDVSSQGGVTKSATSSQCPTAGSNIVNLSTKEMQLELSAGNLTGSVTKAGTSDAIAGAIVYAQAYLGGTIQDGKTEQSVSRSDGRYGLQLDPTYNWKIKVFYVNPDGPGTRYDSLLVEYEVLGSTLGSAQTHDFGLAVRN